MNMPGQVTILFINPFVFAHKLGGMDSILMDLLRHLDAQRFRRIVVLPHPGGIAARYEAIADQVVYVDSSPVTKLQSLPSLVAKFFQIPLSAYRLVRVIRETGAHIVHTQTELVFSSGLAARLARVPSVYMVQSSPYRPGDQWIWSVIVRLLEALADRILVVSHDVRTEFLRRGVRPQKLSLIYNGIDTAYFSPVEAETRARLRAEFLADNQQHIVGMMGRLHISKGVETFLRAAALIRQKRTDVQFVIVGTVSRPQQASYERQLMQLASQLRLEDCVTFTGFRDDVPQVLSAFDVFLFPSLREPFGLALAEAMAMGCAVVASNSGGVPEFVTDGLTGCLVPPNDPAAFAQTTLALLADPACRRRLGETARKHIETHFSIEQHIQAVEAVYEALV